MELRSILLAVFVVALASQCKGHSIQRREADEDVNYDDPQADEATDYEVQNTENDEPNVSKITAAIVTKPTTYNITVGKNLRLECKVNPDDSTVVQWYKDNVTYFLGTLKINSEATRFSISGKDLIIKDVKQEDIGVYRCEIVGQPVSVSHTLRVLESPRIHRFSATNNGTVVEGSDLLLTCEVTGLPPPKIVWSREVASGNGNLKETDGTFSANTVSIKNVRRDHGGKYYCYAFNSVGHNQAEILITVAGKPRIHAHKTIVNTAVNVEAVLQCSAHEEPDLHMRWYKDGKLIEDSSTQFTVSTNGAHSNLTVIPTSDQDFGTFTCEAENAHGKHNRSIELVQTPVLENLEVAGSKVSWTVYSHQPIEEIEIQIRKLEKGEDYIRVPAPKPRKKAPKYDIVYYLNNQEPGKYEAIVKVKNSNGWTSTDPVQVEIVLDAQPYIHTASVLGGDAHSIRPTSTILASIASYLLIRML